MKLYVMMSHFKIGREHYLRKEYEQAVEHFILGLIDCHNPYCMMWLGNCYERGLGVEKDLAEAKDLYRTASFWWPHSETKGRIWLQERLQCLKDVPEVKFRTGFFNGIGNVKVIKSRSVSNTAVRFNLDETVITIAYGDVYHQGFHYAKENLPERNRKWSCDSVGRRFYDGYQIDTDFFHLLVKRGYTDKFIKDTEGNKLTLQFPRNANLEYIYVQEAILKKVKELLFDLSKTVLPQVLADVSERLNVQYGKCDVVMNMQSYYAYNHGSNNDITFASQCIQLPQESLEALCIHELTHNFVSGHARDFFAKMEELGGRKAVSLDENMWKENRWPYLRF